MSQNLTLPRVIGHRGAAEAAPENTLAGFREAKRQGAAWVEFDAKLSADNRCFLLHDDTVDRTTNGKGAAREKSWDELAALDAGSWKGPQFAGERLPLLKDALALFAELDLAFNLELKPCPGRDIETARLVLAELRQSWPTSRPTPLISSFDLPCLEVARDEFPEFPRGLLLEAHPADWTAIARRLDVATVNVWDRDATADWAGEIKAAGYGLLVYTVNDAERAAQLIAWGADGVFTDAPRRVGARILDLPAR
jgi:glycerophosphoryl diester phosphodiesterase